MSSTDLAGDADRELADLLEGGLAPRHRRHHDRLVGLAPVPIDDRHREILLGGEEVVEAALTDVGDRADLADADVRVAAGMPEAGGRLDESLTGIAGPLHCAFLFTDRSTLPLASARVKPETRSSPANRDWWSPGTAMQLPEQ